MDCEITVPTHAFTIVELIGQVASDDRVPVSWMTNSSS